MKKDIHPNYVACKVTCGCGATFLTRDVKPELHVEVCSSCHPFYTGKVKFVDTAGRIEKFQRKFAGKYGNKTAPAKGTVPGTAPAAAAAAPSAATAAAPAATPPSK